MGKLLHLALRLAFTALLLAVFNKKLDGVFHIGNGWTGLFVVAGILTVLNLGVRPLLKILTFPLRLLSSVLTGMLINLGFLWLTLKIVEKLGPGLVTMQVVGGIVVWMLVAILLGLTQFVP